MRKLISNEEYHAEKDHVSSSGAKKIIYHSPAHYVAYQNEPKKPKPHLDEGSLLHTMLFEPEKISKEYATVPVDAPKKPTSTQLKAKNPSADTITAIEWWENFNSKNAGKTIIANELLEKCKLMIEEVKKHPIYKYISPELGIAEESFFVEEKTTGVKVKVRPDWRVSSKKILIDYKSTTNATEGAFGRDAYKYGYYISAAMYCDIVSQELGELYNDFIFIAQEKEPPYAVQCYYAPQEEMKLGRSKYLAALAELSFCQQTNTFNSYPTSIMPLKLPKYAYYDD